MTQFEPYDEGETRLSYELAWIASMMADRSNYFLGMEWCYRTKGYMVGFVADLAECMANHNKN